MPGEPLPLLEEILTEWQDTIGADYTGYKNHVYRMLHCCLALKACTAEEKEKLIIAGAFHDIGVWTADTLDYLPPSVLPALDYLKATNRDAWATEIELMITQHHKVRAYTESAYPLVELFRQGDLVDASRGLCKFGLSRAYLKQMRAAYPHADFWKSGYTKFLKWVLTHPFNPVPMLKW